jgi:hypothetical protein
VLPQYDHGSMPMFAVWPPAILVPARIRAFVEFAADKAKSVPGVQ